MQGNASLGRVQVWMRFVPAVLAALLTATCQDSTADDPALDSGTDADADTDSDTDTDADCECSGWGPQCDNSPCMLVNCDGCHVVDVYDCCAESTQEETCGCGDEWDDTICWCWDADCNPYSDVCFMGDFQAYCWDDLTMEACVDNPGEGCAQIPGEVDCYDPIGCPGGSGCIEGDYDAECWCDEYPPDGGVDGGADGGV